MDLCSCREIEEFFALFRPIIGPTAVFVRCFAFAAGAQAELG
jgi:hypothetical protein